MSDLYTKFDGKRPRKGQLYRYEHSDFVHNGKGKWGGTTTAGPSYRLYQYVQKPGSKSQYKHLWVGLRGEVHSAVKHIKEETMDFSTLAAQKLNEMSDNPNKNNNLDDKLRNYPSFHRHVTAKVAQAQAEYHTPQTVFQVHPNTIHSRVGPTAVNSKHAAKIEKHLNSDKAVDFLHPYSNHPEAKGIVPDSYREPAQSYRYKQSGETEPNPHALPDNVRNHMHDTVYAAKQHARILRYKVREHERFDESVQIDEKIKLVNRDTPLRRHLAKDKTGKAQTKPAAKSTNEQALDENLRLVQTHVNGGDSAKVYRDSYANEYRVKYFKGKKHIAAADSFHDDADDAHGTAKLQLKRGISENMAEQEKERDEVDRDSEKSASAKAWQNKKKGKDKSSKKDWQYEESVVEGDEIDRDSEKSKRAAAWSKKKADKGKKEKKDWQYEHRQSIIQKLVEAKRGRPRKDGSVKGGDDSEDDQHIIMQLRKAVSLRGQKRVSFGDGSQIQVNADHAAKALNKYNSAAPHEKRALQAAYAKSHDSLQKAIN